MKSLPKDLCVAVVHVVGTGGADVCGPCAQDGQRMIVLQFRNAISGELLPAIGIPLHQLPKFLHWLQDAVDREVKRLQKTEPT